MQGPNAYLPPRLVRSQNVGCMQVCPMLPRSALRTRTQLNFRIKPHQNSNLVKPYSPNLCRPPKRNHPRLQRHHLLCKALSVLLQEKPATFLHHEHICCMLVSCMVSTTAGTLPYAALLRQHQHRCPCAFLHPAPSWRSYSPPAHQ